MNDVRLCIRKRTEKVGGGLKSITWIERACVHQQVVKLRPGVGFGVSSNQCRSFIFLFIGWAVVGW